MLQKNYFFTRFFVMSTTNSFVLYQETRNCDEWTKCRMVQFLIQLGNAFVEEGNKEQHISSLPGASTNRLNGSHFPGKIPATEKRQTQHHEFVNKHQIGKLARKETSWWCPDCSVALCVPDCFKVYHNY
ncbi:hypothetical protein PR048_013105, partial [Dryococelus australis]